MHGCCGWAGRIAEVDLGTGDVRMLDTRDYAGSLIGGRGIASRLYWDRVGPHIGAFVPDNALVLMSGPLAGTRAPACSRMVMYGKSALLYPDQCGIASIGGRAAGAMKAAGLDGLVITGKAPGPVVLEVTPAALRLRCGRYLWGNDISRTLAALELQQGRSAAVLCIGPAGETCNRMALVASQNGSCAGHGFGAVWGAKNLKAVVLSGDHSVAVAQPQKLQEINRRIRSMIKGRILMDPMIPGIDLVRRSPCHGCPAGCARGLYRHLESGSEAYRKNCGSAYFYLDWDSVYHGGEPGGDSFHATSLCDRVGLDTQELSKMLNWLGACADRGIVSEQSSGLPLREMGSRRFFEAFADMVVGRTGFGDVLAEGTMRAAHIIGGGAVECLDGIVEASGFSADLYNPRYFITNALFHATDSNPMASLHEVCYPAFKWVLWYATDGGMSAVSTEVLRAIARRFWLGDDAVDFARYEGKGRVAAHIQNRTYAKETLVACDFFYPIVTPEGTPEHVGDPAIEAGLLSAVTGMQISEEEYYAVGERVFNLQRAIRAREGCAGRDGDTLPEFNFTQPLETDKIYFGLFNPEFMLPGPGGELITRKGAVLDRHKYAALLEEYYRYRGWDAASGLQTDACLVRLGLADLIAELRQRNLLVNVKG